MKNSNRGNITIFFSIVLSATILISAILNDALKAALISAKMESSVTSSSNSVLANYSTSLREDYGLLALNLNNNDIYSSLSYYLDNNNSETGNPMKYRVSDLKVDPVYSLSEVDVLKNQILQSCKYDAPAGLVKGVLDKMNLFKSGTKASSILNTKMDAERGISTSSVDDLISEIVNKITIKERDLINNFSSQVIKDMSQSILDSKAIPDATNQIIEKLQSCISATQNTVSIIGTLIDKCSELTSAYNEFSGSIGAVLSEFDISAPASLPTPSKKIIEIKNSLESNLAFLEHSLELAQNGKWEDLIANITKTQYKTSLLEKDASSEYSDSRKGIADAAKDKAKDADANDIIAKLPERITSGQNGFEDTADEIDFEKEDKGNYSESVLDTFSNFDSDKTSNIISELAAGARDKLYIDEYILERFKSTTNRLDRTSVFDAEVEYILNGDASQNKNVSNIRNEISAIRFVLNTIYIYTDPEKVNLAYEVATAISSWWSFGLAAPIIGTLLIFAWSFAETMTDIDALTSGKSVPLMKNKTNWKTDLWGAIKGEASKGSSLLDTNYSDYLRFLLALHSEDEKVLRVGDLIEINLQKKLGSFKLQDAVCGIRVECNSYFDCFYIPGLIKKYFTPTIKTLRYTDYF